jgi:hypothetical protein
MREVITSYLLPENAVDETNGKVTAYADYKSFEELRDYRAKRDVSADRLKQRDEDLYDDLKSHVIEYVNVEWI